MLYAIMATDIEHSLSLRQQARPAHLARLQQLRDEGRLIIAGPFPAVDNDDPSVAGFTGSLIVAEFADLASAQTWAAADPYVEAGVYANVIIKPFKQVF
jgi:uncharacterized protein